MEVTIAIGEEIGATESPAAIAEIRARLAATLETLEPEIAQASARRRDGIPRRDPGRDRRGARAVQPD
jgi:hypothetical protein